MNTSCIALFGEAEKGQLDTVYFCPSLTILFERLGEPPLDTRGLYFAVQTLLYRLPVLFFRVREEGVSVEDYFFGLRLLRNLDFRALFMPGATESMLIEEGTNLCLERKSLLIVSESDFYDYTSLRYTLSN